MKKKLHLIATSSLCVALALTLPFLTGQIKEIGNMLLPMHLPIFVCSYICGPILGCIVGLVSPLLRSIIFGMPNFYPQAIRMSVELFVYGLTAGFIYNFFKYKSIISIYISLLISMILGRLAWALITLILLGIEGSKLTFNMFMTYSLFNAIPGIIIQLILIPLIIKIYEKK